MTALPALLALVADEESPEAAHILAREWGGLELNIPQPARIKPDHPLAQALGLARARRVAAIVGPGGKIQVPLGPYAESAQTARLIVNCLKEGSTWEETARRAHVHVRTVARYAARLRIADPAQPSLFEET